jgi:hypothetical protein
MNKVIITLLLVSILTACGNKETQVQQVNRTVLTMKVSASNNMSQHLYAGKLRAQERAPLSFEVEEALLIFR